MMPAKRASSISFTKSPFPPSWLKSAWAKRSPDVLIVTSSTSRSFAPAIRACLASSPWRIARALPRVPRRHLVTRRVAPGWRGIETEKLAHQRRELAVAETGRLTELHDGEVENLIEDRTAHGLDGLPRLLVHLAQPREGLGQLLLADPLKAFSQRNDRRNDRLVTKPHEETLDLPLDERLRPHRLPLPFSQVRVDHLLQVVDVVEVDVREIIDR